MSAVNNLGTFGKWAFEICRDLNRIEGQIIKQVLDHLGL